MSQQTFPRPAAADDPLGRELRRMEILARLEAARALRRAVSARTRRPVVRANMSRWF